MWNTIRSFFSKETKPHLDTPDEQYEGFDTPKTQNCNYRSPVQKANKIERQTRDKSVSKSTLLESEVIEQKEPIGPCFLDEVDEHPKASLQHRIPFKEITNRQSPMSSTRSSSTRPLMTHSSQPNRSLSPLSRNHKAQAPKPEKTVGPFHLYTQLHSNSTRTVKVWTALEHYKDYPVMQKHLPYVAKVFDWKNMTEIEKSFALREWKLHKLLSDNREKFKYKENEGVLPLIYMYKSQESPYRMMVFPYCYQGDLRSFLNRHKGVRIPEPTIRRLMSGVREALWQMRMEQVMHRDIKPENIFIYYNKCFLGDFGIAIQKFILGIQHESVILGTMAYSSPESLGLLDSKKECQYLCNSDYWSFGVVLFEMTFGFCPFQDLKHDDLEFRMKNMHNLIEELSQKFPISDHLKDLLQGLLRFFPGHRYIFTTWANHAWWQTTDRKICSI